MPEEEFDYEMGVEEYDEELDFGKGAEFTTWERLTGPSPPSSTTSSSSRSSAFSEPKPF